MNMYWVWQMGPAMTDLFGPARTVIIYTAGGIAGFALSSFAGAFFPPMPFLHGGRPHRRRVGAGVRPDRRALSLRPHRQQHREADGAVDHDSGGHLRPAGGPGIDNFAHLGGFAGGYFTSAFLNPMTRERGDHIIIAIVCLVATVLSIGASFAS